MFYKILAAVDTSKGNYSGLKKVEYFSTLAGITFMVMGSREVGHPVEKKSASPSY